MNILENINEKSLQVSVKTSIALGAMLGPYLAMAKELKDTNAPASNESRFKAITGQTIAPVKGADIEQNVANGSAMMVGGLLSFATLVGVFLLFIGVYQFRKVQNQQSDVSMGKVFTLIGVGVALVILAPLIAWLSGAGSAFLNGFTNSGSSGS